VRPLGIGTAQLSTFSPAGGCNGDAQRVTDEALRAELETLEAGNHPVLEERAVGEEREP
jgi:hypothetical protein